MKGQKRSVDPLSPWFIEIKRDLREKWMLGGEERDLPTDWSHVFSGVVHSVVRSSFFFFPPFQTYIL